MTACLKELAEEIRRYCAEHPQARDTLDGIAWWLAMQRHAETRDEVRQAVELLVASGELLKQEMADGACVFGCARGTAEDPDR